MKQSISILTILVFLFPTLSQVWIVVDFEINQDYIAKVFCINKNEPTSGCNGKCHLKQQLKKTEEKDQNQAPKTIKHNQEINLDMPINVSSLLQTQVIKKKLGSWFKLSYKKNDFISRLLRPPQFI